MTHTETNALSFLEIKKMESEGWAFCTTGWVRVANGWMGFAIDPAGIHRPVLLADPTDEPDKFPAETIPEPSAQLELIQP